MVRSTVEAKIKDRQMSDEVNTKEQGWTPPYISLKTLIALFDRMAEEEPPDRIDKSYLINMSGGYQTQVIAALNALGLRNPETMELTDRLKALVKGNEDERKALIEEILRECYAPVVSLSSTATQGQMLEAFKSMGVNMGDTMRKVIAFFLAAAKYSGLPVSKHWKVPGVPRNLKKASGKKAPVPGGIPVVPPAPLATVYKGSPSINGIQPAMVRSVDLRSGGQVTVSMNVDLFSLDEDDHKFVNGLVKAIKEYGEQRALLAAAAASNSAALEATEDDIDEEIEETEEPE
jgi:hypothetical protein